VSECLFAISSENSATHKRQNENEPVNGAIRIAIVILDDLQHSQAGAFPRLCVRVFSAKLSDTERRAQPVLNGLGKLQ
jgi:hypothetical protein